MSNDKVTKTQYCPSAISNVKFPSTRLSSMESPEMTMDSGASVGCPDSDTGVCMTLRNQHENTGFIIIPEHSPLVGCPESETGMCEVDDD
mmetsp:Transcript_33530/g.63079  ORF Transcript_33530/g.63079 Transcript_33530/m.63079 type:complete len:90 (+) Transcript_33530:937-1206(+)